jgi:hypothetical protein
MAGRAVVVELIAWIAKTHQLQRRLRSSESRTARSRSATRGCCRASRTPAANPACSCRSSGRSCPSLWRSVVDGAHSFLHVAAAKYRLDQLPVTEIHVGTLDSATARSDAHSDRRQPPTPGMATRLDRSSYLRIAVFLSCPMHWPRPRLCLATADAGRSTHL